MKIHGLGNIPANKAQITPRKKMQAINSPFFGKSCRDVVSFSSKALAFKGLTKDLLQIPYSDEQLEQVLVNDEEFESLFKPGGKKKLGELSVKLQGLNFPKDHQEMVFANRDFAKKMLSDKGNLKRVIYIKSVKNEKNSTVIPFPQSILLSDIYFNIGNDEDFIKYIEKFAALKALLYKKSDDHGYVRQMSLLIGKSGVFCVQNAQNIIDVAENLDRENIEKYINCLAQPEFKPFLDFLDTQNSQGEAHSIKDKLKILNLIINMLAIQSRFDYKSTITPLSEMIRTGTVDMDDVAQLYKSFESTAHNLPLENLDIADDLAINEKLRQIHPALTRVDYHCLKTQGKNFFDILPKDKFEEMNEAFFGKKPEKLDEMIKNFEKQHGIKLFIDYYVTGKELAKIGSILRHFVKVNKIKGNEMAKEIYLTNFLETSTFGCYTGGSEIFARPDYKMLNRILEHENAHYIDRKHNTHNNDYYSSQKVSKGLANKKGFIMRDYGYKDAAEFIAVLNETIAEGELHVCKNKEGQKVLRKYYEPNTSEEDTKLIEDELKYTVRMYKKCCGPEIPAGKKPVTSLKFVEVPFL